VSPKKQEKEYSMTHQDAINSSFEVGKGMSEHQQEAYLKEQLKRSCYQKTPSPRSIDGDQPQFSPVISNTEMEHMVRNVQHHKEAMNLGKEGPGQESATPTQEGS